MKHEDIREIMAQRRRDEQERREARRLRADKVRAAHIHIRRVQLKAMRRAADKLAKLPPEVLALFMGQRPIVGADGRVRLVKDSEIDKGESDA